jgi:D-amino-acid dehydrogenase
LEAAGQRNWSDGQRAMPTSRHVAILGAGAVGAVSAIEALRSGHRVTIVEPSTPGGEQASSYGNAGWLSSHSVIPPAVPGAWRSVPGYLLDPSGPLSIRWSYLPRILPWLVRYLRSGWTEERLAHTATALRTLLVDAPALHKHLADAAGVGDLIERQGVLHIYPSRADYEAEALAWRLRRAVGVDWTELSGPELRQHEPMLDRGYDFGLLVEEAGRCKDPGAYVARLVSYAQEQGAELVAAKAHALRMENGQLAAVQTEAGEISCDVAVVSAGARSKPLAESIGDVLPLETERGYHVTIEGLETGPRTTIMVMDKKMVINWTERGLRAAGQVEFAGLDAPANWKRAEILREQLLATLPALPRGAGKIRRWLGNRPSMPDGRPCIGYSPVTRDVVYAFGHGHVGLVGSARTGRLVAQLVSGAPPEIDLAPFDPARFSRRGRLRMHRP